MKDKSIVEMSRPLVNEEVAEVVKNYAKGANKDTAKVLQQILEVVDHIRTEVEQQGKDLTQNTVETQNLRTEFNAFRDTVNKKDARHQDKVEDIVRDTTKETVQSEIPKVLERIVRPHKGSLKLRTSLWRRIRRG